MAGRGGTGTDRDARLRAALRANLARRKARGGAVAPEPRDGGAAGDGETDPASAAFPAQEIPEKD